MKLGVPLRRLRLLRPGRPGGGWCLVACVGWVPTLVLAQSGGGSGDRATFSLVPRVSLSERYTNNVSLVNVGKRSELVTQVSPGISYSSQSGKLIGSLDYSLNQLMYARNTSGGQSQNALTSNLKFVAVDNFAYIDFVGNISQQQISAFGTQSSDSRVENNNFTETANYQIAPYLRGRLGGFANYEARYSWSTTRSRAQAVSDVRTNDVSLRLDGATSGPLGWNASVTSQDVSYSQGNSVTADRLGGSLLYTFNPQLSGSVQLAREYNNYTSMRNENHGSAGMGLNWAISERSRLSAQLDRRSFGHSHSLSFDHRTGRTAWKFSDSQSVATTPVQSGVGLIGTLGELLSSQFASIETDPLKRADLVNRFLLDNGLNSDSKVISNFLNSSVSLQRRQEFSVVLLGVRDTITFSLSRATSSQLENMVTAIEDTSNSSVVRQTGFNITYAHRLTPDANFNVVASRQITSGDAGIQSTALRSVDLILTSRLNKQMTGAIGLRRSLFDSATAPYSETSVTGNLSVQF